MKDIKGFFNKTKRLKSLYDLIAIVFLVLGVLFLFSGFGLKILNFLFGDFNVFSVEGKQFIKKTFVISLLSMILLASIMHIFIEFYERIGKNKIRNKLLIEDNKLLNNIKMSNRFTGLKMERVEGVIK